MPHINTTKDLKNERGQTMAELALVLPVLLVLLLGIAQFGVVFNNYISLTDAVRAGARKGSRLAQPCRSGGRLPRAGPGFGGQPQHDRARQ